MLNFPAPLDYTKALERLFQSTSNPKLGFRRIQSLLDLLGNPHRNFKSIHVAGTNGKGSTCAFLSSLCQQGFSLVGKYTSPHLLCARERIQLNDQLVEETLFCEAEAIVNEASEKMGEMPSFFERLTAMAFWIFAQKKIDIAIIEVGLGGRFDATNVIHPLASIITRIDLDHQHLLGNTIEQIAYEKAGIIKNRIPVATGWQSHSAMQTIERVALEKHAPLHVVSEPCLYNLKLIGQHQKMNAALALQALSLAGLGLSNPK